MASIKNFHPSHSAKEKRRVSKVTKANPEPIVPLERYESGHLYNKVFRPLLVLEANYRKRVEESWRKKSNVSLRWDIYPNDKVISYFKLEHVDAVWNLLRGDQLELSHPGPVNPWTGFGRVLSVSEGIDGSEVGLMMDEDMNSIPIDCTNKFSVNYVWNATAYKRMMKALQYFADGCASGSNPMYNRILGLDTKDDVLPQPRDFKLLAIPNFPDLTPPQVYIVKEALQHPLPLITGAPGTGKTVTALAILYHLVKQNKGPVLVCAPSNVAVDQLVKRIHEIELKVIRLFAKSQNSVDSSVAFLSLHNQVEELNPELAKLHEEMGIISESDEKRLCAEKKRIEQKILNEAEVVCCTCIAAADARLLRMKFSATIIDECMQAIEPECIVPLMRDSEQLILVGDLFGLRPVVQCEKAIQAGLRQSLFKRLIEKKVCTFSLNVQFRMHPALSRFPAEFFYEGDLFDGVSADERRLPTHVFPWPDPDKPMVLYSVQGPEEQNGCTYDFTNRTEASIVELITIHLLESGIKPEQIGVITPFRGQRDYITLCMEKLDSQDFNVYKKIEIGKVDAFQSREKDIIIISCVRSDKATGVGSLNYEDRINLALTRAKLGLIIVANPVVLSKQPKWKQLVDFFKDENLVVENFTDDLLNTSDVSKPNSPTNFFETICSQTMTLAIQ